MENGESGSNLTSKAFASRSFDISRADLRILSVIDFFLVPAHLDGYPPVHRERKLLSLGSLCAPFPWVAAYLWRHSCDRWQSQLGHRSFSRKGQLRHARRARVRASQP